MNDDDGLFRYFNKFIEDGDRDIIRILSETN